MSARLREHKTGTAYPVLVVDDHALFSTSLTLALRGKGFDARTIIVARVEDYLSRQAATPAGLVVLDLDLEGDTDGERVNWARLIDSFRARDWMTLVVSGNEDWSGVAAAIAAGAIGFVPKSQSFGELLRMVVTAAQGVPVMTDAEHRVWLERHRNYFARVGSRSRRITCLSAREREVMELLAEGKR